MTKEELLKKIEDMPMDAEICLICPETGIAVFKEVWDFCIQKDNDISQVMHDLLCDVVGIVVAIVALAIK